MSSIPQRVSVKQLADSLAGLEIQRDRYVLQFVEHCDGLLDDEMVFHALGELETLINYSNRLIALVEGLICTYAT